jgi:uncharacterized integral membrane protein (TIGR00698 family)
MEAPSSARTTQNIPTHRAVPAFMPGLLVALAIAAVASLAGHWLPVVGAPVIGIVAGMALAPLASRRDALAPGVAFAGRQVLQASVVVLGLGLSLRQVATVGVQSLPVMLGTLALALAAAWGVGRLLRIGGDLSVLIGVGTAICGASAIAATNAVIRARHSDVVYAISTIFLFNVVAVLLYPTIGHLLGLSQPSFGLWVGTAVNDTSSVVAAGYTYGAAAGAHGVVVKLARTLMIIPIVLTLQALASRSGRHPADVRWHRLVPWFIPLFLLAAGLDSVGAVPAGLQPWLAQLALFMLTAALAGVGLSARFDVMRRTGFRPLLLGAALWAVVGASSLAMQALTGKL